MNSALQNDQLVFKDSFDKNIHTLNFFDEKLSVTQSSISPNDDGRGSATPNDDGNDHPCTRSSNTSDDSEDDFATSMGDNSNSEGNSSEPNTYYEAVKNPNWIEAINQEIEALYGITLGLFVIFLKEENMLGPNGCLKLSISQQSKFNYSLFTKKYDDVFIAMLVYVDDIVITGSNLSEIEKFKLFLKSKFQIKDLVKLKYFLGIEVLNNKDGICLSQRKYCLEILHEYGLLAAKYIDTPLSENTTINHVESDDDHLLSNVGNYQRLVGKLIYLTNTRPGISYVVHCLSQFMHTPFESHLDDALRVSRYLKGSPGRSFQISKHGDFFLEPGRVKSNILFPGHQVRQNREVWPLQHCDIIWVIHFVG
ncbi:ribonuclease H-like domain-containing protein [Tanacetum coccineum]